MDWIRKPLGALFALVGAYYCALGLFILTRLPAVTRQWVDLSGDPDFTLDYRSFVLLSALGAISIAWLGWSTVAKALATMRGQRVSWMWPAIAAVPLHWFWFLYRIIGAGALGRDAQLAVQRDAALQFGIVCAGYIALWVLNRRSIPRRPETIGLQTSTGPSRVSI